MWRAWLKGAALCIWSACAGEIRTPSAAPPTAVTCAPRVAAAPLRRLTHREYALTTQRLLGEMRNIPRLLEFPADVEVHGFDTNAEHLTTSNLHVQRYEEAALSVSSASMSTAERRAALIDCDLTAAACVRRLAQELGELLYRRPLLSDEVQALVDLAELTAGDSDPYAHATLVLQAMLLSPDFLFRVEHGGPADSRGLRPLTGHELATRLSFFLLGSAPSKAMLAAAAAGELDTLEGLVRQTELALAQPEARAGLQTFSDQWLHLQQLDGQWRDPARFPQWNELLRDDLKEQTRRDVEFALWAPDGSVFNLYAGTHSFLSPRLADFYGLPSAGPGFSRVAWPASAERSGLMTHGSILTFNAVVQGGTVIRRARYIRDVLLCDPLPPPPPGVPALRPPTPGLSERARLAEHRSNPGCSGCHDRLDPLGFGLERYDEIGAHQTADGEGHPLTGEGEFSGKPFTGGVELSQLLKDSPLAPRCVSTMLFRYAMARDVAADDTCTADHLTERLSQSNGSFHQLLLELLSSDTFRYRRAEQP